MTDLFGTIGRFVSLIFVPGMIVFPLLFLLLVPNRAAEDRVRRAIRAATLRLALATILALVSWFALLLVGLRHPWATRVASFWWSWFFPLWFFMAMPLVTAKLPSDAPTPSGEVGLEPVRTASLANRERQNPVTRGMWWIPVLVYVAVLAVIAARGLVSFPMESGVPGDPSRGDRERSQWILNLGVFAGVFGLSLAVLPRSLRRLLIEPEPMDAGGSEELTRLYAIQRRRRVLGLFWGGGVLLPVFMGTVLALPIWFPAAAGLFGLLGGMGGAAIGIVGAVFGTWMSVERSRIAAARKRLDAGRVIETRAQGAAKT